MVSAPLAVMDTCANAGGGGRKMTMPLQLVHFFNDREVHMVGENVGVCWNLKRVEKETSNSITWEFQRIGEPYIDFVWIRKDATTLEYYEDDDNIGRGGMSIRTAKTVAYELLRAVAYIASLEKEGT